MTTHHCSSRNGVIGDVLQRYQALPQFSHIELVRGDEKGFDEQTPLHIACYRGDQEAVSAMLGAGASTCARGDVGGTPLHEAALGQNPNIVRVLLEHGADVSAVDDYGDTPLDIARSCDHQEIVQRLVRALGG